MRQITKADLPDKWVIMVRNRVKAKIEKFLPEPRELSVRPDPANDALNSELKDSWDHLELALSPTIEKDKSGFPQEDLFEAERSIDLRKLRRHGRSTITDKEARRLARSMFHEIKTHEEEFSG